MCWAEVLVKSGWSRGPERHGTEEIELVN